MRPLLAALAALLALLALPSPARAGEAIILESYVGEKPADAEQVLAPLLEELAKNRFVAGPAVVGGKFERTVSRPAVDGRFPADFGERVSRGYDLWTNGKFNEAVAILGPLIELARHNPGEFARDQTEKLQQQLQQAQIGQSLSQLKLGDRSAARHTMTDALLGDPGLKISRGMYGQEASELYEEVRRELTARGTGKVIIEASGAGIYVNERLVGMGKRELYLLPGEYRVIARLGDEISRAHRVVVAGGDIHQVTIDPAFDRAVHTGPGWTGLLYASSGEREHELRHGNVFARELDADQVVVVGIETVHGRRMIRGALINKGNGDDLRTGSIPLDANPSEEQRRNLARFLNGAPATPDIIVGKLPGSGGAERRDGDGGDGDGRGARPLWSGWKYVTGGGAIAAGAVGGVLLAYDGRCSQSVSGVPCANRYATATQGWIGIGGAIALAGVTVYLVVRERREVRQTAYVAPVADGGAIAGYAIRF